MRITAYLIEDEYDYSSIYSFLLEKPNRDKYDKVWIDIPDSLEPEVKGNDIAIKINGEVRLFSECSDNSSEYYPVPSLSWDCDCSGLKNVHCSYELTWGYVNE